MNIITFERGGNKVTSTLEMRLGILPVEEAIAIFENHFPNSDWNKLQIEHEGPFYKYEMVGNDGTHRNTLEINAHTGKILKDKQKPLKPKAQDPIRRERKKLNMSQQMSLTTINDIAQKQLADARPFQWELDRQKNRTVWKIEFSDTLGENITEYKIDAQDGTIVQIKLKN